MEGRQEYLEMLERKIEDWTARLETLEARAADADPEDKAEYEERIDELWSRLESARDQHGQLREADGETWADRKRAVDQAWSEVEDAYSDFERTLARV
jgi:chromosome segregation ATPase